MNENDSLDMQGDLFDYGPDCETEAPDVQPDALLGIQYVVFVDVIAGLGLLGNICCFLLMMSRDLRHLSYSVFLRVLPVTDSIVLVFTATEDTLDHGLDMLQSFEENAGKGWLVWATLLSTARMASPWLVACLAFNRLALVLYSGPLQRLCTVKAALVTSIVVVLVSLVLSLPYDQIVLDGDRETLLNYSIVHLIALSSLLPCLAILGLNVSIGVLLRRSLAEQEASVGVSYRRKKEIKRYTVVILVVSALAFLCLIPKSTTEVVEALMLWSRKGGSDQYAYSLCMISKLWPVLNCIMLVNFGINFYVLLFNSHLRGVFLRQLCCCCPSWGGGKRGRDESAAWIDDKGSAGTTTMGQDNLVLNHI